MDNVTHGLAGLLMADVTVQAMSARSSRVVSPRVRRATVLLGIVAAEFPDSDLLYSGPLVQLGPLGYLLHHRGHTHTLVWATISALALWLVARWWVRRGDSVDQRSAGVSLLWLALAGTWSHLLLDWTNSYGVHPFWPFDDRWYYGDAVFIVEPWLWLVAIPPLLVEARSRGGRVALAALGLVILAASVFGPVARAVAVVLGLFAGLWMAGQRLVPARWRAWAGLGLWALVTGVFVFSARSVRVVVTRAVAAGGDAVLDVVLTPAPGDPTCWSALVVSRSTDRATYRLTSATVGLLPPRPPSACAGAAASGRLSGDVLAGWAGTSDTVPFAATPPVAWRRTWTAPVAELVALAASRCEVEAALRFMRTPAWQAAPDGTLRLVDVRYGVDGGFNVLAFPPTAGGCSLTGKWLPPWTPPRRDLLRGR